MKALQSIGWQKAVRFVWTSFFAGLLHWCWLPQLRVIMLRIAGAKIGSDSLVFDVRFANLYHYGFKKLHLGKRCFVGDEVMLDLRGGITLLDDVTISNRASIVTHINVGYPDHPLQKHYPTEEASVRLLQGSYLGTAAIILPGVTVGEMSVIGAGAVVTKDLPAKSVAVGVPARIIKKIK